MCKNEIEDNNEKKKYEVDSTIDFTTNGLRRDHPPV